MEKPESGVAVFFDSDGSLYWKTADGVVRRGARVTDRDAVLGSSAVDVGVGSASTICIRDGAVHLQGVAPSDSVRAAYVAASIDRIADALNNDPAPHAVAATSLPTGLSANTAYVVLDDGQSSDVSGNGYAREGSRVALSVQWGAPREFNARDRDGKLLVEGAFYWYHDERGTVAGPCRWVDGHGVAMFGDRSCHSSLMRRVPIDCVTRRVTRRVQLIRVDAGQFAWSGELTPSEWSAIESTHAHERVSWIPTVTTPPKPTVEAAPKIESPLKRIVRCGQRWRLDGVEVELYDVVTVPERGSFMVICGLYKARNWEGVRVNVSADALKERGVFLSGPTEPETHAEAVRRVLELEAASPPDGLSRDEWRARLINRLRDDIKLTGTVRMMVCAAREEHAEKWRKFGGGK